MFFEFFFEQRTRPSDILQPRPLLFHHRHKSTSASLAWPATPPDVVQGHNAVIRVSSPHGTARGHGRGEGDRLRHDDHPAQGLVGSG